MKLKVKKLRENAVLPFYAKHGDAGLDLTAANADYNFKNDTCIKYFFGIAVEIPDGHVGLIFPRSSVHKTKMTLSNCVGVIDSGYRGEVCAIFYRNEWSASYKIGERVAQMIIIPYPKVTPEWADELLSSERGDDGFGSTGK
jgi:dUTP pyrophosphatase